MANSLKKMTTDCSSEVQSFRTNHTWVQEQAARSKSNFSYRRATSCPCIMYVYDVYTGSSKNQNLFALGPRQNSRGSTNRTLGGGDVVQSSSSLPALSPTVEAPSFLIHQTSSSHENLGQCGTTALAGSSGPRSAARTAHAGFLRATLCACRQSERRSAGPSGPDMRRPYMR